MVARDYEINPSSLHRHRVNCLRLGSANAIKKEAARGSAAVALLPSKETLSGAFSDLAGRIDEIIAKAQAEGSLSVKSANVRNGRRTSQEPNRQARFRKNCRHPINSIIRRTKPWLGTDCQI